MRFRSLATFIFLLASAAFASAQGQAVPAGHSGLDPGETSVADLGVHYAFFHANAPPSQCGCFSLEGGGGTFAFNLSHRLSFVSDLSAGHASNLNGTNQTITVFDFLFGPRLTFHHIHRFIPYAQILLGGSQETSNYAAVHNVKSFAWSGGVGFSTRLSRHFSWNVVEADYIYSQLPNGVNNFQNDLRVTTGLTLRLGPK
jgi:peptidoglycan-associated lipoprotein